MPAAAHNVLGEPLQPCCTAPATGYLRDGHCRAVPGDAGMHTVCALVTAEFLQFTREHGNDLSTPRPEAHFAGLRPGDRWCLCATRWREALQAGVAPPVDLKATDKRSLDYVSLEQLQQHALADQQARKP